MNLLPSSCDARFGISLCITGRTLTVKRFFTTRESFCPVAVLKSYRLVTSTMLLFYTFITRNFQVRHFPVESIKMQILERTIRLYKLDFKIRLLCVAL